MSYSSVLGPKNLPFRVQGEFRTNGLIGAGVVGIVYHVGNDDHAGNTGFKIVLSSGFSAPNGYQLGFSLSQHTSYYEWAESVQTGLDDGNWHSFEAIATAKYIQLVVDGVEGTVKGPSDERGVQEVKEFGRIETTVDYVLGRDPCCVQSGEQRTLSGEIRNVVVSWLPPSNFCTKNQGLLCNRAPNVTDEFEATKQRLANVEKILTDLSAQVAAFTNQVPLLVHRSSCELNTHSWKCILSESALGPHITVHYVHDYCHVAGYPG